MKMLLEYEHQTKETHENLRVHENIFEKGCHLIKMFLLNKIDKTNKIMQVGIILSIVKKDLSHKYFEQCCHFLQNFNPSKFII